MQDIATFTSVELHMLQEFVRVLEEFSPSLAEEVEKRKIDLELLAGVVSRSPSPMRDIFKESDRRDLQSLTRKMVNQGLDQVVNLPAKAVLGRGFTVSKLHFFGLVRKLAATSHLLEGFREDLEDVYNNILFTLMAEDLYANILSNSEESDPWVARSARELVLMWDFRTSPNKQVFAPYITDLWNARRTLVPVLGTLLGTMELMRISSQLPDVWLSFLGLPDEDLSLNNALEEFLFDLSYEQISSLRSYMAQQKVAAVSRETARKILLDLHATVENENGFVNGNSDSLGMQLYRSFLWRQRNARSRRCQGRPGPTKTLEEHFVMYLMSIEK